MKFSPESPGEGRAINVLLPVLFLSFILISGCTLFRSAADDDVAYESYAGSEIVREQLKSSFDSIKRIHNTVLYNTYVFDAQQQLTVPELKGRDFARISVEVIEDDHSTAGTAIVLGNNNGRTTMITASHTVTFPDTIWHYRRNMQPGTEPYVDGVSVRQRSNHFHFSQDGLVNFEVAVNDARRDLALLVHRWDEDNEPNMTPLQASTGNHERLDWGDLVYALGYPRGVQMMTRGMVSKTSISPRRSFVVDASFNRGFSGGALFTVKSDGSGIEWVGILSAAYGEQEYYLSPGVISEQEYHPDIEYDGPVYLQRANRINYGITYAVGMDEIGDFLRENRREIRRAGLTVPSVP
jgi:hypothetical protein